MGDGSVESSAVDSSSSSLLVELVTLGTSELMGNTPGVSTRVIARDCKCVRVAVIYSRPVDARVRQ